MNDNIKKIKSIVEDKKLIAPAVISIDGPCGSGKSTIALEIEKELGYNILHMDDFYLPFQKRDKNWMNIVAGHIDFDRLIKDVLEPYKKETNTNYISYDCHSDKFMQEIPIDLKKILVIEGSYSSNPKLHNFVNLKIYIDIDKEKQVERLIKRNPDVVDKFLSMWIPFENRYFEELQIKENSELILNV